MRVADMKCNGCDAIGDVHLSGAIYGTKITNIPVFRCSCGWAIHSPLVESVLKNICAEDIKRPDIYDGLVKMNLKEVSK